MDIGEKIRRNSSIYLAYSRIPLGERLKKLTELRERKEGFEKRLVLINQLLFVLETMPDIAEQEAKTDPISVALLRNLREYGEVPYELFLTKIGRAYGPVIQNRISLLERAGLVRITRADEPQSEGYTPELKIKLTERGENLQYAEQTK